MNEDTGEAVQSEESSYFYSEGVAASGDKPEWFKSDKYKTISDQAEAYVDAEKRIGEMGSKMSNFTGAPDAYDLTAPEGFEFNTEDPMLARSQEWAKGMNLSQEGYTSLVGMYAEMQAAESKASDEAFDDIKSGIDNFESRTTNINDYLKANEMEALADVITSKDQLDQFEKLLELSGKSSISVEGETESMPTQEEIETLMFEKDENGVQIYGRNKERTERVRKMMERRVGKGMHHQEFG
jgi:hypothetical protein